MNNVMLDEILTRVEEARKYGHGVGVLALDDVPRLVSEIKELRDAISWGVSCGECSNQLAEEWEITEGGRFLCRECIEEGAGSE